VSRGKISPETPETFKSEHPPMHPFPESTSMPFPGLKPIHASGYIWSGLRAEGGTAQNEELRV
jgi:hypothetical protein